MEARVETRYVDKLEGRIPQEFFDRQAKAWRQEQQNLWHKIDDLQRATPAPIDEAIDTLRLTSQTCELFLRQTATEQRRLLQVLVQPATWRDGKLQTTLFEPSEISRHSNRESSIKREGKQRLRV